MVIEIYNLAYIEENVVNFLLRGSIGIAVERPHPNKVTTCADVANRARPTYKLTDRLLERL